ncbi:chromate resistance protein ChrB domain-containing protein [Roseovarius sp.]|uniref:chromate resistance protein ChrB domain-containing protein n=1 Tax=Roseovarius sp. TaxID=1486281 RepID=UPI000C384AB3|nr:chromate resistance protein ChrB domain-containing protein [Roseovarius sp.]MAO27247.1 sulfurtransferase [Roseovarius sp.]MAZ19742.1 sulfurtransferase [Roseovarius sp.]
MPAPNELTPAQLSRLIGTPDCPRLIDLTLDEDFAQDPYLIPGAERHSHRDLPALTQDLQGQRAVLICQKGAKLSQGAAAWLAGDGIDAMYLQGGNLGWRDTPGTIRLTAAARPPLHDGATLWVTRHRPKIDRIACPWLIRRFVDRRARFLFVAPDQVADVAARYGATPFDIDGVPFSHRGEACSFDTMLDLFGLGSEPLRRLALVIRAADTNRHDLHPAAAGLLAISVGLSRQYRNDQDQLTAGLPLYDALYRWARDGYDEVHDWPGTAPAQAPSQTSAKAGDRA